MVIEPSGERSGEAKVGLVRAENFGLAPLAHTLEFPFPYPGYRPVQSFKVFTCSLVTYI